MRITLNHTGRFVLLLLPLLLLLLVLVVSPVAPVQAQENAPSAEQLLSQLQAATGGKVMATLDRRTGVYNFVRTSDGTVLALDDAARAPDVRALDFLRQYGPLLGIASPADELRVKETSTDLAGVTHLRWSQQYRGLPVFGAEVVVHLNGRGITAVNGTFVPAIAVDTQPALTGAEAAQRALAAVAKANPEAALSVTAAPLAIYRSGLLEGYMGETHLAYGVIVEALPALREQVWVDATNGRILNRISLVHEDLYRIIYSPKYDPRPRYVRATEEDPPNALDAPAIHHLFDFAGQVYDFFDDGFGRDSYDGQGHVMESVYLANQACPNAYWNGVATNYCPGFDIDDVVAHEWGHAYTEFTHGLIYQYQSGALNESYSDIWGEAVDLHNGMDGIGGNNNEDPYPVGKRWVVGEDLGRAAQRTLLRNMWDPTTHPALGPDPDKVSSPNYACGTSDGGGVHSNSGVPNHAFAMLTDGKTFNGREVRGLGFVKTTHIYYQAMTAYQVPTTNFPQHADALEAACNDLLGVNLTDFMTGLPSGQRLRSSDCREVRDAMAAVEMRAEPVQCNYQPIFDPNTPPLCQNASLVFEENWESGMDGWSLTSDGDHPEWPTYNWTLSSELPDERPGTAAFAVDAIAGTCAPGGDYSGHFTLDSPALPITTAQTELRFEHWVATELEYDGGNLKVSVNGAPFALVPPAAITFNAYNTTLAGDNPNAEEPAWSGTDEGTAEGSWGTSIVDLSLLGAPVQPGDTVVLRWDFSQDGCNGITGWYLDTVQLYTCQE